MRNSQGSDVRCFMVLGILPGIGGGALLPLLAQEVIHLQVPLQIPCYDLALLAESQFEPPKMRDPY